MHDSADDFKFMAKLAWKRGARGYMSAGVEFDEVVSECFIVSRSHDKGGKQRALYCWQVANDVVKRFRAKASAKKIKSMRPLETASRVGAETKTEYVSLLLMRISNVLTLIEGSNCLVVCSEMLSAHAHSLRHFGTMCVLTDREWSDIYGDYGETYVRTQRQIAEYLIQSGESDVGNFASLKAKANRLGVAKKSTRGKALNEL